MQRNPAETYSKLSRCPENVVQPSSTSSAQFPRVSKNQKFIITPESMGMKLPSNTLTPTREQQAQQETPALVEVKPYYERHSKTSVEVLPDCKHESNVSFPSAHSNTPTNSYASITTANICQQLSYIPNSKIDLMTQSPSPNSSPKTPSQQWNFEASINNDNNDNNFMQTLLASPQAHCGYSSNITSFPEAPIFCTEQHPQKYRSGSDFSGDDAARLNFKILNDIYAKRIKEIDANAFGGKDFKIFTYQQWVEMLTKINESFISNVEELEREVFDRLEFVQKRINNNCRHSQDNELMKTRKDVYTLLNYIKNVRNCKTWDLRGLTLETVSPDLLLDMSEFDNLVLEDTREDEIKNYDEADVVQKNKLYANMKALAHEVAEKHDEVRELKRQVISLEDEIQKAQKKIQLKDDVIKELRNDLKAANNKISSNPSLEPSLTMPPINFENQTCRSSSTQITDNTATSQLDNGSLFDFLSHTEHEETQKIKLLDEEIKEFFEVNDNANKQKMEYQRQRIMDIMKELESEKAAAYRKLDFIRRQLIDLESDNTEGHNDCDSGFHSKSENDQDAKILDAIRKRLRRLNEMNCELKKRIQKLELERNELDNTLQMDKSYSQRNDIILKQIADLLCAMQGKQFSYTEIYNTGPNVANPFCEAIAEMQREFQEKERQLLISLRNRNKRNEELSQLLMQNEKNFNEDRAIRLNLENIEDIDNTAANIQSTSLQSLPVTTSICIESSQAPSTPSSTSLTGQQLDSKTAAETSLHKLVDK